MKTNNRFYLCSIFYVLGASLLTACGGGGGGNSNSETEFTYSTTSSKGDYSEWTLTDGNLAATWNVVADDGAIDYSFDVNASCAAADITGTRECTVNSSSCSDGVSVCPSAPTGNFSLMDVPGVALFVVTDAGLASSQLHVGFVKNNNACSDDVSGDYTVVHTGLGLRDSFGLYRSDTNFINIMHTDFGFQTTDANASQTVSYNTGAEAATLTDAGCSNGVRERGIGGDTIRSMMTNSGLFVLDFPAGQGGLVAFKIDKAASLTDFANKSFGGISFPDNNPAEALSAEFGPLNVNQVGFTATFAGGDVLNANIKTLTTVASITAPAYPDFATAPTGYDSSALFVSYPTVDAIPGIFKFDQLDDDGRVIMIAMKFNNKVIAIGMVYNYRTTTDIDPSVGDGVTTFSENALYNTGNFILFEK